MKTKTANDTLGELLTVLKRWEDGDISSRSAAVAIRSGFHHLSRACWCDDSDDVCCMLHDRHTDPHRNCILRGE